MRIRIGVGNAVTTTMNVTAKTLTFNGAYNFDIDPLNLSVYSSTAGKYIFWQVPQGTAMQVTANTTFAWVSGLLVQTVTFSAIPSGVADGDTLIIFCECPDEIATYNAIVTHS